MLGDEELHAYLDADDLRGAGTWLVKRYAHEVHGLCSAMIRDRHAAEDLAQDVFSRAFRALDGYRREASSRTWLLAIARNRCIDHLRSRGRAPFTDSEPDDAPDDSPLTSELLSRRADVVRALATLDEGERALVVLRYRHGLSYDELANVFGLKAGTTRMRVSRALSRMRAALQEQPVLEELAAPQRASAPRPAAPESASYGRSLEAERFEDAVAMDDEAALPPPGAVSAPQAKRRRGAGILSRIFGSKEEGPAPLAADEGAAESAPPSGAGGAPPLSSPKAPPSPGMAPPPRGAPAGPPPSPLARALWSLEPSVPEPFESRLLDLASQL